MSTYTAGPRTVEEYEVGGIFTCEVRAMDGVLVAKMTCAGEDEEAVAATRADAFLDAAGPEMLEALQMVLANKGARGELTVGEMTVIRAAIAKATRTP